MCSSDLGFSVSLPTWRRGRRMKISPAETRKRTSNSPAHLIERDSLVHFGVFESLFASVRIQYVTISVRAHRDALVDFGLFGLVARVVTRSTHEDLPSRR